MSLNGDWPKKMEKKRSMENKWIFRCVQIRYAPYEALEGKTNRMDRVQNNQANY